MVKKETSLELIIANKEHAFQSDGNKKRGVKFINFLGAVEMLEKWIKARVFKFFRPNPTHS
jgi:hypothetical protein